MKWIRKNKGQGHKPSRPMQPTKFQGGLYELDGNYFDCTGYGQADQLVKTVVKIADLIGRNYKNGGTTRTEVMTQTSVPITVPLRPVNTILRDAEGKLITSTPPDPIDTSEYLSKKKIHDYQLLNQNENRTMVYYVVWPQCTESIHSKIKAHKDYLTIEASLNGIELLKVIKLICFNIEDTKYVPMKVDEAKVAFYVLQQGRDTNQAYQMKCLNIAQVIEKCGAHIGEDPLTRDAVCKELKYRANTAGAAEKKETSKQEKEVHPGNSLHLWL